MKKVLILADIQNIYYTTKQAHHCHFDYNAFWAEVTKNRDVLKAIAYTTDRGDTRQREFQNILRAIGFEVKLKPYIQRSDGTSKGDWDVGITLDAMEYAQQAEIMVLASGDGDFDLLVAKIRRDYAIPVDVYGVAQCTARSLIDAASTYIPIENNLLLKKAAKVRC